MLHWVHPSPEVWTGESQGVNLSLVSPIPKCAYLYVVLPLCSIPGIREEVLYYLDCICIYSNIWEYLHAWCSRLLLTEAYWCHLTGAIGSPKRLEDFPGSPGGRWPDESLRSHESLLLAHITELLQPYINNKGVTQVIRPPNCGHCRWGSCQGEGLLAGAGASFLTPSPYSAHWPCRSLECC